MEHYLYLLIKLQYPGRHETSIKYYPVKIILKVNVISHFTLTCKYISAYLSKPFQHIHHYRSVLGPENQKL